MTIGDGVEAIGYEAFRNCSNLERVVIGNGVVTIGENAFYGCGRLSDITIGSRVETISSLAFYECSSLTTITIPGSVSEIAGNAFNGCASLESIGVATANTAFASVDGVFFNNDKTELILYPSNKAGTTYAIPTDVTAIGANAFNGNENLETITIPSGVETIGDSAFRSTKITSVVLPDTLKTIGEGAFAACNLTSITIPKSVETLGKNAFWLCKNLEEVTFELNSEGKTGLSEISQSAFASCGALESIEIPEGIENIQDSAFSGSKKLKTVTFPSTLKYIGKCAFTEYSGSSYKPDLDYVTFAVTSDWKYCSSWANTNRVDESNLQGNCAEYFNSIANGSYYWQRGN